MKNYIRCLNPVVSVCLLFLCPAFIADADAGEKPGPVQPVELSDFPMECFESDVGLDQCPTEKRLQIAYDTSVEFFKTGTLLSLNVYHEVALIATYQWKFLEGPGVRVAEHDFVIDSVIDVLYLVPSILRGHLEGNPAAFRDFDEVYSNPEPGRGLLTGQSPGFLYQMTIYDEEYASSLLLVDSGEKFDDGDIQYRHRYTRRLVSPYRTRDHLSALFLTHGLFLSTFREIGNKLNLFFFNTISAVGLGPVLPTITEVPTITLKFDPAKLALFSVTSKFLNDFEIMCFYDYVPMDENGDSIVTRFVYYVEDTVSKVTSGHETSNFGEPGVTFDWPPVINTEETDEEQILEYARQFIDSVIRARQAAGQSTSGLPTVHHIADWLTAVVGMASELWETLPHSN